MTINDMKNFAATAINGDHCALLEYMPTRHILKDMWDGMDAEHINGHIEDFEEMVSFLRSISYEYIWSWERDLESISTYVAARI